MKRDLILITIILIFCSITSYSCTCIGKSPVDEAISKSDVIVSGKVISQENFIDSSGTPWLRHLVKNTIQANEVLKGKLIDTKTITIFTGIGGGDCGYPFELNESYLIYATWEVQLTAFGVELSKYLTTGICTRTKLLDKSEVREIKALIK